MSDPTGLGKHQDGSLIYQYVAARNWWKYWPSIDAVFDDSDFTSCFDNRESAESRHMTFLKQPTIWFSLAVYHDTLKWYLYHACWVQFYKVWILCCNKVKILVILLQRLRGKHDFLVPVYDWGSPVIKCKRYHTQVHFLNQGTAWIVV